MSGSDMSNDTWRFSSNGDRTLLLVGRTGDGKSATGNSILGRNAFTSMHSSSGVTKTCSLRSTLLEDGRTMLNLIDTPGLFNISCEPEEFVIDELVKCMDWAKDGIHAVLVVLSIRMRFSREELAAVQTFQALFGNKICDYMIVVFTGGDELEENDSLDAYLGHCPEPLKETLNMCGNRRVLFDNKTKDPSKIADQLRDLLSNVSSVVKKNGGPYTKDLFIESKERAVKKAAEASNQQSDAGSCTPAPLTDEQQTQIWLEVNGGVKKGNAYMLGSLFTSDRLKSNYLGASSSYAPSGSSSVDPEEMDRMKQQIALLRQQITQQNEEVRKEREETQALLNKVLAKNKKKKKKSKEKHRRHRSPTPSERGSDAATE